MTTADLTLETGSATPGCPFCHNTLWVNEGVNGPVLYCGTCNKIISEAELHGQGKKAPVATKSTGTMFVRNTGNFAQPFPAEIPKWSWAAFTFNWLWALARGLWGWGIWLFLVYAFAGTILWVPIIGPLISIPLSGLGLILCIWLGWVGNAQDWKRGNYANAYAFRKSHRRWFNTMWLIKWALILDCMGGIVYGMCQLFQHLGSGG